MAGLIFDANFNTIALVAATAKTVIGVKMGSDQAGRLHEIVVSADGADATKAPLLVALNRCTFATNGPGTNSTAITLANFKRDPGRQETPRASAAYDWSAAPTVLALQQPWNVPQFNGVYHLIVPFTVPLWIPGGQGIVLTITSPFGVNVSGRLTVEE